MNNMLDHLDDKGLENIIRQAQMDNYHHEVVIAHDQLLRYWRSVPWPHAEPTRQVERCRGSA